jgi:hypothetical protein
MNITKAEQKQIDRARVMGRGALLRTMAQLHRAGSKRTQKAIDLAIESANAWDDFTMVNGALLHNSEV